MKVIRIATRQSDLAIAQSNMIASALQHAHPQLQAELLPLSTKGDREKNRELLAIGGKGLFTKEIEQALLQGDAEIAMHSLKDMPMEMPSGLILAGVLPRDRAEDVLVLAKPHGSLAALPQGMRIGTSSPRRKSQLLAFRPDFEISPFRGNVPTRLDKLATGEVEATILAAAGLDRLNISPPHILPLPLADLIPAVGQGLIAIQCREDDHITRDMIAAINHAPSFQQAIAERAYLRALEGDCHTPLAGHAQILGEEKLHFHAQVLSEDGKDTESYHCQAYFSDAEDLGLEAGEKLKTSAKRLWQRYC